MPEPYNRIDRYEQMSSYLARLSNATLQNALREAEPGDEGIVGKSTILTLNGKAVFVKKIPLTTLEQRPDNLMSTANMFNLPLYYQYGVGSKGFGAWRELSSHLITTNWVLEGECNNFPILYHWRILPGKPLGSKCLDSIEERYKYWGNCDAIKKRMEELKQASAQLVLFIEYIPCNLHEWLGSKIAHNNVEAEAAANFVDKNLQATNDFMKKHDFLHFDVHFKNILTDGKLLYFSDFGLALSSTFTLSASEVEFFIRHKTYDEACAAVNLLHCIITSIFGKGEWIKNLQAVISQKYHHLPPTIENIIKKYAPIAFVMDDFFYRLRWESKLIPYPKEQIETLLKEISL